MNRRFRAELSTHHRWRGLRAVGVLTVLLLATGPISGSSATRPVAGQSGDLYLVRAESEVWRSVGPALFVRFHTSGTSRSSAAAEASDILPYFAARADSARLRYLLLTAYRPIVHMGSLGVYRAWNFRYERAGDGWTASDYW
jgi:hypothetical protein